MRILTLLFVDTNTKSLESLLLSSFLSGENIAELSRYKLEETKKEKAASMILKNKYIGEYYLNESGKPLSKSCYFNISHSKGYVVFIKDDVPIGVDIEKVEERPESWAKEYFTERELLVNTPAFLTELWAKKEAILKLLQIGLTVPAKDIEITGGEIHFYNKALDIWALKGSPKIVFETKNLDGGYKFILAYPDII